MGRVEGIREIKAEGKEWEEGKREKGERKKGRNGKIAYSNLWCNSNSIVSRKSSYIVLNYKQETTGKYFFVATCTYVVLATIKNANAS